MPEGLRTLLLEIGTEELPARFLPPAIVQMEQLASRTLTENLISFSTIKAYATPRRLVLFASGIPNVQKDVTREVFGPPQKVAFAPDGSPTQAALKFAASLGIGPEKLVIKEKNAGPGKKKGQYAAAVVQEKGAPTATILPGLLKELILSLTFPKTMRWGDGSTRFARPIHNLLAVLGGEVLAFEIQGIKSCATTAGHRFLSPSAIQITDPAAYIDMLREHHVIVDQDERKHAIAAQMAGLAKAVKGSVRPDEELLLTVTNIVEYPRAVMGSFSADYLTLPGELLVTVMRDHQKYFPIQDKDGRLMNNFIMVTNTLADNDDITRVGAERVLRARFEDARFYYDEDRTRPLESRLQDLKRVTFHDKLGTLHEKTLRVQAAAGKIAQALMPETRETLMRAALLSKADLVTGVVREFPELQGLMGGYYALNDKEDPVVAQAIKEQYLPPASAATPAGALLGLSDRMDNLVSFFCINITPTGSEDPFALRRQALAVVAALLDKGYAMSIKALIQAASPTESITPAKDNAQAHEALLEFFKARVQHHLLQKGYPPDAVNSTLPACLDIPPKDALLRLDAILKFKADPDYNDFLLTVKRVKNIIPKEEHPPPPQAALLAAPEEKALAKALKDIRQKAVSNMQGKKYYEALRGLTALTSPVNDFFDKVMVMDKDEKIRANRLGLLSAVWETASLVVANFSELKEKSENLKDI